MAQYHAFGLYEYIQDRLHGFQDVHVEIELIVKNDIKYGQVTVSVVTPWYDLDYWINDHTTMTQAHFDLEDLKSLADQAVSHLSAAINIQTNFGKGKPLKIPLSILNAYKEDPLGFEYLDNMFEE